MSTNTALFTHPERSERRKQIAEMVRQGDSVAEAAWTMKVTPHLVYAACKQFGVPIRREKESWPIILKQLFDEKLSIAEISEQLNVTIQRISAVYVMAAKAGIPGLPVRRQGVNKGSR